MSHSIQMLDPEVINQIAAGEVVERPANMFKELIENSIDAGADKIEIQFGQGGCFVQIKDNGMGIKKSDLTLALKPHSTSKIASLKDIWSISSYGFRGEALASISEISDFTLISKTAEQEQGARIYSRFGKHHLVENISSETGTTIIVKNLFQNIPARLKFLKSPASESTLIKSTIKAMALSHPFIEFRVLQEGRLLFYWKQSKNLQERAEEVLSLRDTLCTNTKYKNTHVTTVFCPPNETTHNRKQMWFFVEGRWVDDTTLHSAVMSAYRGLLMHGEYPIIVLCISCPKEDLDVNVHPAKSRVRFKNSGSIFQAVQHSLRTVLEKAPWLKKRQKPETQEISLPLFPLKELQKTHLSSKTDENIFPKKREKSIFHASKSPDTTSVFQPSDKKTNSIISAIKNLQMSDSSTEATEVSLEQKTKNSASSSLSYWSSLYILSQAHLTYIIAQDSTAIIFIDQHAAHERVLYEKLMLTWNTGKGDIQKRLDPLTLRLEENLSTSLMSLQKNLAKIGLEIEKTGPEEIGIYSAPAILKDLNLQFTLKKLAEENHSLGKQFALEEKISDICASMACHSAVRAGQALSKEEMSDLLSQMDLFPLSSFCPHGRPVFVRYPLSRLEKDFGRRP